MNWDLTQFSQMDIRFLRFIQHHRIEDFDGVLSVCSWLTTYISLTLLLFILLKSILKKSIPLRLKFYKLVAVFTASAIASYLLKSAIFRQRPFVTYPDIEKLSGAGNSSFPSGHTMEVFAMAFAVSILFPQRKFVILAFLWAFFIAYTRMALGVHYPFDVLSGMVIGILVSYFTLKSFDILEMKHKK